MTETYVVPAPGMSRVQEHPHGTLVLVLGILGLVGLSVLAPSAQYFGSKSLREIDANPGAFTNRGNVVAGRVLGIIGTVLLGLVLVFVLGFFLLVAVGVAGASSGTSSFETDPAALVFILGMFFAIMGIAWTLASD
jgi:hypothetical protein